MGGVDHSDFMRMARYSVQQAYHTRKWYKSIFLSLFDLAIVNAYILHNIVFPVDKPIFLTRPEFMYALADEMIHYVHMLDVTGVKRRRGGDKVSENPCSAGHTQMEMLSKDEAPINRRSSRSKKKDACAPPLMYGHSGKDQKFKDCVVCKKFGDRVKTKFYCDVCQGAVCKDTQLRANRSTGEKMLCWDVLHSDHELINRFKQKSFNRAVKERKWPTSLAL